MIRACAFPGQGGPGDRKTFPHFGRRGPFRLPRRLLVVVACGARGIACPIPCDSLLCFFPPALLRAGAEIRAVIIVPARREALHNIAFFAMGGRICPPHWCRQNAPAHVRRIADPGPQLGGQSLGSARVRDVRRHDSSHRFLFSAIFSRRPAATHLRGMRSHSPPTGKTNNEFPPL